MAKERLYQQLKKHFQGIPTTTSHHEIEVKLRRLEAAKKLPASVKVAKILNPTSLLVRKGVFQIDPSKGLSYRDACRAVSEAAGKSATSRRDESGKPHPSNEEIKWKLEELRLTISEADRSETTARTTPRYDSKIYQLLKTGFEGFSYDTSHRHTSYRLRKLEESNDEIKATIESLGFWQVVGCARRLLLEGVFCVDYEKFPDYDQAITAASRLQDNKELNDPSSEQTRKPQPDDLESVLEDHLGKPESASATATTPSHLEPPSEPGSMRLTQPIIDASEGLNTQFGVVNSSVNQDGHSSASSRLIPLKDSTGRWYSHYAVELYNHSKAALKGTPRFEKLDSFRLKIRKLSASNTNIERMVVRHGAYSISRLAHSMARRGLFLVNYDKFPTYRKAVKRATAIAQTEDLHYSSDIAPPRKGVQDEVQSLSGHSKSIKQKTPTAQRVSASGSFAHQEAVIPSQAVSRREKDVATFGEADSVSHGDMLEGPISHPWTPLRLPDMDFVEPTSSTDDAINLLPLGFSLAQAELAQVTAVAQTAANTEVVHSVVSDTTTEVMRLEYGKAPVSEHVKLPSLQELESVSNEETELDTIGLRIFESQHPTIQERPIHTITDEIEGESTESQIQEPGTHEDIISPTDLWFSSTTNAEETIIANAVEQDETANQGEIDTQQLSEDILDFNSPRITTSHDTNAHDPTGETQSTPEKQTPSQEVPTLAHYKPLYTGRTRKSRNKNMKQMSEPREQSAPQAAQTTIETTPLRTSSESDDSIPHDSIRDDNAVVKDPIHPTPIPNARPKQAEPKDGIDLGAQIDKDLTLNSNETDKFRELGRDQIKQLRRAREDNRKISDGDNDSLPHISQHATMPLPQIRAHFLPYWTQYRMISHIQALLEELCFEYVKRKHPDFLEGTPTQWELDCPESMELTRWLQLLEKPLYSNKAAQTLVQKQTGRSIGSLWRSLVCLRNYAVHRNRIDIPTMQYWIGDARAFAKLLDGPEIEAQFADMSRQLQLAARELIINKANTEGKLLVTVKELSAKRAELDRLEREAIKAMEEESTRYKEFTAAWLHDSIMQEPNGHTTSRSSTTEPKHSPSPPPQNGVVNWLKSWFGS
ncbi:hypothetical protein E4T39_06862 [Aureobasidium subglaciale]|nr:hypothetical protein E4T39_06862 [Aureobasidium subglaciale]